MVGKKPGDSKKKKCIINIILQILITNNDHGELSFADINVLVFLEQYSNSLLVRKQVSCHLLQLQKHTTGQKVL